MCLPHVSTTDNNNIMCLYGINSSIHTHDNEMIMICILPLRAKEQHLGLLENSYTQKRF